MTENKSHCANDYSDTIVGIDLGTTNSSIAVYQGDDVKVFEIEGSKLLPSYVGLSPTEELLIGHSAHNQYLLFPERTVKSIKRRMGGTEKVALGKQTFLPEEISAMILSHLKNAAESILGETVKRAVITVPAYFNDTQRKSTRAAGEIAGLEVVRVLNEPTAASLAYRNTVLGDDIERNGINVVYDLGGGTFDVSIVRDEDDITEVLASHGDTKLGGDDFDRILLNYFLEQIQKKHNLDLRENRKAINRLNRAAEEAKIHLSSHPFVHVMEEDLIPEGRKPVHLDLELTREQYEEMIHTKIEHTIKCVEQALQDAQLSPSQIDGVLLVGGSTRIPLVRRMIEDFFNQEARTELHPDLCVTMGAAILGARIQGLDIERILVDITPYTFGVSSVSIGEDGFPTPHHFAPIIPRNTPLPVTRSEEFATLDDYQETILVEIYQGEDDDVRYNTKIGDFRVEGLSKVPAGNVIIDRMSLDLNGILTVTAMEKSTGLQKSITIEGAYKPKNARDISEARSRLADMIPSSTPIQKEEKNTTEEDVESLDSRLPEEHRELLKRARSAFERMHPDDRKEAEELSSRIESLASENKDYEETLNELQELLYFVGA